MPKPDFKKMAADRLNPPNADKSVGPDNKSAASETMFGKPFGKKNKNKEAAARLLAARRKGK